MIKPRRFRYWFVGLCSMLFCLGLPPAIAHLPPTSPSVSQGQLAQASRAEQQAQAAYDAERYQAAIERLQEAQQQYQRQGRSVRAAIALGNLSLTYQRLGNWGAADAALTQAWGILDQQSVPQGVKAQILDIQGQLAFGQGDLTAALDTWQQAEALYDQIGDSQRQVLSRLNQAQALQAEGLFQQVFRTLRSLEKDLDDQPDSVTKATLLRQLGDSLRATGRLQAAATVLQSSLTVAENLGSDFQAAATTLSLGNLAQAQFQVAFEKQGRTEETLEHANVALANYQAAARAEGTIGVQARLNLMQLITNPAMARWDTAAAFYPAVQASLTELPPSRAAVYGYIGLAENLITLKQRSDRGPTWSEILALLSPARTQAEALGDPRALSQVLGTLGSLYEQTQQWEAAAAFSREALALAQQIRAADISYRWQWQLGRILTAQAQSEAAISVYTEAFETLGRVRSDLITANPNLRFSFREGVEPIYRELAGLLLSSVPDLQTAQGKALGGQGEAAQARLRQAREVIEALQLAELENFFQAACLDKAPEDASVDEIVSSTDGMAAVVYSILLADRLEVVMKFPQQADLVHFSAPASRATIDTVLSRFRTDLITGQPVEADGQQLYDWLLRPAAEAGLLTPETIETLVFVLDGNLRLLPMATLHDGQRFLIETYALSLVLGLEVRNPQPLPAPADMEVLAASLTTPPPSAADTYGELPNVNEELDQIAATGLATSFLRDQAFTSGALKRRLDSSDYTVVHLATHGQFGRDRQSTFILAADGRIDVDTLGQLFSDARNSRTPIELLVLSACKTATGSSREVLGIAGATVQAGARSSIATLWSVDDDASVRFTESLYAALASGASRAEALRQAQLRLLQAFPRRPRYWAPYVLVGSWR